MADIDIEKKKPIWPWILLAVVVLIVLLIVFIDDEDDAEVITDEPIENTMGAETEEGLIAMSEDVAAIEDYLMHVEADNDRMGIDHEYTYDALILLIDAIQAMADEVGYNIDADISEAREVANFVIEDPLTEEHANRLTQAFRVLSDALENLQEAHYPTLADEVDALNETAASLNPDEMTLDQRRIVNPFFNQAANILRQMN